MKIVADNRKARFDYTILDTLEAGLALTGSEVKSIRDGTVQLKDSYIDVHNGEMFLIKAHISVYKSGGYSNHEPERRRKLLLHKHQIEKFYSQMKERGLTVVPLKMYLKEHLIKLEVALVKGKKSHDKREAIKTRDENRSLAQLKRKFR